MRILKAGTTPSAKGPVENFTGSVLRDALITSEAPGRVSCGANTFEPGGRTV